VFVSSIGTLMLATLYRLLGGISAVAGATNTVERTYSCVAAFWIGRRSAA
jgi:hypothetical protein